MQKVCHFSSSSSDDISALSPCTCTFISHYSFEIPDLFPSYSALCPDPCPHRYVAVLSSSPPKTSPRGTSTPRI
ncbi:hypothetical protein BDZ89DRAFT_1065412, partial [Hymenopellis radicata]